MSIQWSDNNPIYRQLKDKLVGMMLDGDICVTPKVAGSPRWIELSKTVPSTKVPW